MNRKAVAAHYNVADLTRKVLGAIEVQRGSLAGLTLDDLAPVDGFHIRGRRATVELAEHVRIDSAHKVLDVGSGPGGTARYLASRFDCRVVGLDLTFAYAALSNKLSQLLQLDQKTAFLCGNAVDIPFNDDSFDVIWTEHVQMNIRDKATYLSELARVLKPSGKIAVYEVFKGVNGDPHLPAPWSSDASTSFVIESEEMRALFAGANLDVLQWQDVTDTCHRWFQSMQNRARSKGPPSLGIHLLLGAGGREKIANMGRSLADGRATVIMGVVGKPQ